MEDPSMWTCQACNRCVEICPPQDAKHYQVLLALRKAAIREFCSGQYDRRVAELLQDGTCGLSERISGKEIRQPDRLFQFGIAKELPQERHLVRK